MNHDYSSRSMEQNCKRDINFMYLLEGMRAPDHATFARFRTMHFAPCAKKILAQVTNDLYRLGEISGENIFIDGTKIEADAGYVSEENYLFIEENGQTAFIKPANYEIAKTRKYKQDISRIENMDYNEKEDVYLCRNGKNRNCSWRSGKRIWNVLFRKRDAS